MSREAQQPATPMSGAGGFSRSSSNASASGTGRQRGTMLRTHSTTASDAALVAQLQVQAEPRHLHLKSHSRQARLRSIERFHRGGAHVLSQCTVTYQALGHCSG